MFTLTYLLASFFVLGLLDVKGWMRINSFVVYLLSFASILLSVVFGVYHGLLYGTLPLVGIPDIYAVVLSIIVLMALPGLGFGDKLFLSSVFFLYPFWFVWLVVILASMLIKPAFALLSVFIKKRQLSLPFYPFLFASTLAVRYVGLEYVAALMVILLAYLFFSEIRKLNGGSSRQAKIV